MSGTRSTVGIESEGQPRHDQTLTLKQAATCWYHGEWKALSHIDAGLLAAHPDRIRLALLQAGGNAQCGNLQAAKSSLRLARQWGATTLQLAQMLAAGVHRQLDSASTLCGAPSKAQYHCDTSQKLILALTGVPATTITAPACPSPAMEAATEQAQALAAQRFCSAEYWEQRYRSGGHSGAGSQGKLAAFKAAVVNAFVARNQILSVIELGCGDGMQLQLLHIPRYIGVDVSPAAIARCQALFAEDSTKTFLVLEDFLCAPRTATLALSMDVLFHLVEDQVFDTYMYRLFASAEQYVIIYASDAPVLQGKAVHVRGRRFTTWIDDHRPDWELYAFRQNNYPYRILHSQSRSSFSDFYFYRQRS
ncbi:class I SAM-dependent methyltransferase [Candidatus Symbiobacter mobilis]|uniref:Glycosyltransferase-like protein n=1 Tax=Candidatus Symbiobacter mobilis CR TaxID=946483 RepID=U5NAX2_9BURK|nr:class I SAM-dependent methyltransferase [Candidatus Symbiobacter mobilis]AGX88450.1 glycosyltransferase-like protein [Candidatus Symbiobacter mobilis CR]